MAKIRIIALDPYNTDVVQMAVGEVLGDVRHVSNVVCDMHVDISDPIDADHLGSLVVDLENRLIDLCAEFEVVETTQG